MGGLESWEMTPICNRKEQDLDIQTGPWNLDLAAFWSRRLTFLRARSEVLKGDRGKKRRSRYGD